jgi:small subunit ribosomal protein S1
MVEEQSGHSTESGEENFADLLEKSMGVQERLEPGQKVKTRIIGISGDLVYVDLGGKSDGVINIDELRDENGAVTVKEGDAIEAFFISVQDGIRKLTTLINGYSPAILHSIRDAYEAGLPITGEVKREIKGGFEVTFGGMRGFCPFSQIDLSGGREGGIYLGQSFPFKILEYEENGKNIVVSRRVLLEEEKQARLQKLKETLVVGMEVTGKVRSIQNFGAFVDLGGIDGMIPASELSWNRIDKPGDVLSVGQDVTAKIISVDWERDRITLSLKAMQPDPWLSIKEKYLPDGRVTGTIVRLAPFGVFVNLEPGIDGLIHISNLGAGRRINHPKEIVEVGQQVEAYILSVNPENRKIALSLHAKPEPQQIILPAVGELLDGVVERIMPYGIFLKINEDITGLIPNSEMDTPVGSDHSRMFPEGTPLKVVVIEVDTKKGKVRLSRKGVADRLENDEYLRYKETVKKEEKEASDGLGTLGKLLKAKMEEKGFSV